MPEIFLALRRFAHASELFFARLSAPAGPCSARPPQPVGRRRITYLQYAPSRRLACGIVPHPGSGQKRRAERNFRARILAVRGGRCSVAGSVVYVQYTPSPSPARVRTPARITGLTRFAYQRPVRLFAVNTTECDGRSRPVKWSERQQNTGKGSHGKDKCPDPAEKPGQGRGICGGRYRKRWLAVLSRSPSEGDFAFGFERTEKQNQPMNKPLINSGKK